jgi:hypothetical protein
MENRSTPLCLMAPGQLFRTLHTGRHGMVVGAALGGIVVAFLDGELRAVQPEALVLPKERSGSVTAAFLSAELPGTVH